MSKNAFWLICACLLALVACSEAEQETELPTRARLPTSTPTNRPTATPIASPTATLTATSVPPNIVIGENGVSLEIERFELRDEVGNYTPGNDAYLVLFGSLHNQSNNAQRIYASDVRLILDGTEYAPQNGPMGAIQDTLETERPYVGAYRGQEVDANSSASTLAVFDIPFDVGAAELALQDQHREIAVSWRDAAVAMAATEPPPTATMTVTVTLTNTITPTSTRTATVAPVPTTQAEVAQEEDLTSEFEAAFSDVVGVISVELVSVVPVRDNLGFSISFIANVESGYNTRNEATRLLQIVYDRLGPSNVWSFSVILDDDARRTDYSKDNRFEEWQVIELPTSVVLTRQPPPPTQRPPTQSQQNWVCTGDQYNCGDFSTCSEVMDYFNACPGDPSDLDGNSDGVPCESLCGG